MIHDNLSSLMYLPGIFRGTFLRHTQYTMLANRWTWTFSYRRIPEFRRGRSQTRIHGICWLIYRRRDIRIDRSTGSFYFHRCERSNRLRQCRNHLWTQRQKLYNRSPFSWSSFSGRKFCIELVQLNYRRFKI